MEEAGELDGALDRLAAAVSRTFELERREAEPFGELLGAGVRPRAEGVERLQLFHLRPHGFGDLTVAVSDVGVPEVSAVDVLLAGVVPDVDPLALDDHASPGRAVAPATSAMSANRCQSAATATVSTTVSTVPAPPEWKSTLLAFGLVAGNPVE